MIQLNDLLGLAGVELSDFKIHCATGKKWRPIEAFFDGQFKEWQEDQGQKNFQCEHIVSLIYLEGTSWLFAGVWEVKGVQPVTLNGKARFRYKTKEIKGLEHLVGRAIIDFNKNFRASYLRGEKYVDQLLVSAIRPDRMTIGEFPGYNDILLSLRMLRTLVSDNNPSWRSALSNVAGVYLITDIETGQAYVGSAYGGDGIWQRWMSYSRTGHGGNKELRALLGKCGKDYANNFQFTLLEVCDLSAGNDFVIGRESHWKDALKSREFGLNSN